MPRTRTGPATEKTTVVNLRVTPQLKARLTRAAAHDGLSLSEWIRAVLARAADLRLERY